LKKQIDIHQAEVLASESVARFAMEASDQFELIPTKTKTLQAGWVFFYNSSDFVRTGNPLSALAGNGPLFVTTDGRVHVLPSAVPWEQSVAQFFSK